MYTAFEIWKYLSLSVGQGDVFFLARKVFCLSEACRTTVVSAIVIICVSNLPVRQVPCVTTCLVEILLVPGNLVFQTWRLHVHDNDAQINEADETLKE